MLNPGSVKCRKNNKYLETITFPSSFEVSVLNSSGNNKWVSCILFTLLIRTYSLKHDTNITIGKFTL